jgi:methylglutaconyl-CoA hydratase
MSEGIRTGCEDGVARIWLDRPGQGNALDEAMIHALHREIERASDDGSVRVIVIAAEGQSFCSGADPEWMRRTAELEAADNFTDACQLAALFLAIASSRKPVIARVQGLASGGGVGLIAACDIAIGTPTSSFALSEVRSGQVAATVLPYLLSAIGARHARRMMLTGEPMGAAEAHVLGLLQSLVASDRLDEEVDRIAGVLKLGGPHALAQVKDLVLDFEGEPFSRDLLEESARRLVELRASREGREGLAALLEKKRPSWCVRRKGAG